MDVRYPILEAIDGSNGRIDYVSLLNCQPGKACNTKKLLTAMRQDGLISGSFTANSIVRLEPKGAELLLQLRQDAQEQHEDACKTAAQKIEDATQRAMDAKKQRHHEWLTILVSAGLSSVITLGAEHFDEVCHFFVRMANLLMRFLQSLTSF